MATVSTSFTGVTVTGVTAIDPGVVTAGTHGYTTGDVVLHEAMDEMTELNGQLFDIETIDGNSYWLRSFGGNGARLSTAAFTAETTGGTSSLGLSAVLTVPVEGEDITVTLTGTWVATIALEEEIGYHSNVWKELQRWTANTVHQFSTKAAKTRYRLRLITWTSGTITSTLADGDKIEQSFLHDDSTEYMEVTQAQVTMRDNLIVDGNLTVTGTQTFTGTLDVVTLDAEVIEAGDASLGINGLDAAQGGEILLTGGTSSTAANDGGAVGLVGGTPGVDGKGGAVNLTGGVGGSTSDIGGAIVIAGGAATTGNTAGGLASVTGGASTGSGTGGVVSLVGGAGSAATGVGGGITITGGAGNTTGAGGATVIAGGAGGDDAVGGLISLTGGAAGGGNRAGGAAAVVGGAGQGTAAGGAVDLTSGAAENGAAVGPGASGAVTLATGAAGTETTSTAGASGAVTIESVAGGAATGTAGIGGASGALIIRSGAGGAATAADSGVSGVGGALTISTGAGGLASGTGASAAGGALILETGAGGGNDLPIPGNNSIVSGASGALTIRTGAGGALTAGNSTAGAAGTLSITGGAGGEAIEDADDTGGAGANVNITAGAGGDGQDSGVGGSVVVTPGTLGTTGGGTAAIGGSVFIRGNNATAPTTPIIRGQALAGSDTGTQSLTAAEMMAGIHANDPQGSVAITMPDGQTLHNALPADFQTGDSFDFTLINLNGSTGEIQTLTDVAGTGVVTIIGKATVDPPVAAEGSGSGTWRFVSTGSNNFNAYRIS